MVSECFNSSFKQQHTTNSETMKSEMGKKPKHSNKAMSFIKVLGRDFSKQLQLPEEFTTNLNGYVPHRFIIESGLTRKCWRVEVEKDEDGRIFFRDGWADFVEAHSLEVGNFLLFEYEEQSIFQVRIYGRNGFERSILVDSKGGQLKPETTIDDDDGEKSEAVENEPVTVRCRQQKTRLAPRKYGIGISKKKHAVHRPYKRTPLVSAKVSQNNSGFSIRIHHSKVHQFNQLTVPKAVSLKMKLPSKQMLKFQDARGKCWNVTLGHRRDGRAIFCQGWKEFMKDNKIAAGDYLKFDFTSDEIVRFHVRKASKAEHLSDDEATGSLNMDCTPHTPSTHHRASNPTSDTKPHCDSGSSFSVLWRESVARTYLYMPKSVVRGQDLGSKESIALRDPEGKCWPLEVKKLSGNRVVLTKGWVEFWKGHGVKTGDLLQFKFVSEYLIQVTINQGKPLHEADVEGAVICLEDAIDNEDDVAIGQKPLTQEEFEAVINQAVISKEEFDAAMPLSEN